MDKDTQAKIVNEVAESVSSLQADLLKLTHDVVVAIEMVKQEVVPLSGPDKQTIAVAVLNGYVKLPFPFSWCQSMILKLVVNYAVAKLNSVQGHSWLNTN